MDQQTQPRPPVEPQQPAPAPQQTAGQQPQKNGNKVWLWIIGGCLTVVIIAGLIMGGLAWWGAKRIKKAVKEAQPQWEEMQKGAEQWQKDMEKAQEEWQKETEKMQNEMPDGYYSD